VTPGVGGKIFLSWGSAWEGEGEITTWEPGKKLAWKEPMALEEWTIEARGGRTILKLVQSGFLGNEDWEDEWNESTSYGWDFMLLSMKWLLEKPPGAKRQVAWPRVNVNVTRQEAYKRVMAAGGAFLEDANLILNPGTAYAAATNSGEKFTGRVKFVRAGHGFCITIRELNEALLWLTIEGLPGKIEVQAWLSAFGLPEAQLEAFRANWEKHLHQLFA
jgi:hypothetical protein